MILVQSLHINNVSKYPLEMPSMKFKVKVSFVGLFSLLLRTIGGPKNSRDVSLQVHVFKTAPIQISGAVKTSVQR